MHNHLYLFQVTCLHSIRPARGEGYQSLKLRYMTGAIAQGHKRRSPSTIDRAIFPTRHTYTTWQQTYLHDMATNVLTRHGKKHRHFLIVIRPIRHSLHTFTTSISIFHLPKMRIYSTNYQIHKHASASSAPCRVSS